MTNKADRGILLGAAIISAIGSTVGIYFQLQQYLQPDERTILLIILFGGSIALGTSLHYLYRATFTGLIRKLTVTTFDPVLRDTKIKRGSSIAIEIRLVTRRVPIRRRLRLFNGYIEIFIRDPHGKGNTILRHTRRTDPIEGDLQFAYTDRTLLEVGWEIPKNAVVGDYVARIFLKDRRPYDWMYFKHHTYVMEERVIRYTVVD